MTKPKDVTKPKDQPIKCEVCRRWMRRAPAEGNKTARQGVPYVQRRAAPHANRCVDCAVVRACRAGGCEQCRDLGPHPFNYSAPFDYSVQSEMMRYGSAFSRLLAKFYASDERPFIIAADDPDGIILGLAGSSVSYMDDGLVVYAATSDVGVLVELEGVT